MSTNEIILGHRGIVTRGHARMNKEELFAEIDATLQEANTGDGVKEFLLIGKLESPALVDEIDGFSSELRRAAKAVSEEVAAGQTRRKVEASNGQFPDLRDYFEEFHGRSKVKGRKGTVADCYHGEIVRALHEELSKYGKTQKNRPIDLVARLQRKALLFEVKPSIASQSIYTAIGQLVVHAPFVATKMGKVPLQKIIVLPTLPPKGLYDDALDQQGIRILVFNRSSKGRVTFDGLAELVAN